MSKQTETILDLIRHGEPQGGQMFRGNTLDHPLSEKGWQQMRAAVDGTPPWQRIFSSPMLRCSEFAEELASRTRLPLQIQPGLLEIGFGKWAGKTKAELLAEQPEAFHAFYQDPENNTPPEAEPLREFAARIGKELETLRQQCAGEHILAVTHAGVMKAAISQVLEANLVSMYRMNIHNAGIVRLIFNGGDARLDSLNARL